MPPKVSYDGKDIIGRDTQQMASGRPISPDMAAFAVNLERFMRRPGAQFSYQFKNGQQTLDFLRYTISDIIQGVPSTLARLNWIWMIFHIHVT